MSMMRYDGFSTTTRPAMIHIELALSLAASIVTLASVTLPLLLRTIVSRPAATAMGADVRVVVFLITQVSIGYIVHTLATKIPGYTPHIRIWLLASIIFLCAMLATLVSVHIYYPRTPRLSKGVILLVIAVFQSIVIRRSGHNAAISNYPFSLLT